MGADRIMKIKREAFVDVYITEAFLLLLKKKEYRDITITEICKKAGVTRMSFYRNFESKEDILHKKVRNITDSFLKESAISYKNDTVSCYFIKLFTHMKQQIELCNALNKAGLFYMIKDEFDRVFLSTYRQEYDEYKSVFLAGGIYNIFLYWFLNNCRDNPEDLAKRLDGILMK